MKVQTLLDQAAQCKTDDDVHNLVFAIQDAFVDDGGPLANIPVYNPDWSMEDEGPFARLEFIRELTDYYNTVIRPEIRDGKFVIVVITNRMKDGLGMESRHTEMVEGFDDNLIEGEPDQDLRDLAQKAVELAIADHGRLLETVGVSEAIAKETAQRSWEALK